MKLIKEANLSIHPRAIEAMGADLVTDDNIAILELIKNAYDAFAYEVTLEIGANNEYIKITDNGLGMDLDTIENSWAQISTTFKLVNKIVKRDGKERIVSGNKGLGRLSAARLGNSLTIITKCDGQPAYCATLEWVTFYNQEHTNDCKFNIFEIDNWDEINIKPIKDSGTILIIKDLKSDWMPDNKGFKEIENVKFAKLKVELERLLDPFSVNQFSIYVKYPNCQTTLFNYSKENDQIVTHPLISNPPYKIIGRIDENQNIIYNYTYIENFKSIGDRKVREDKNKIITWDEIKKRCDTSTDGVIYHDDVKCGPFSFEIRVWDLDNDSLSTILEEYKKSIKSTRAVRDIIVNHKGISVYRDGVLVLPKSEATKDWLGLDKKRIGRVGSNLSTSQIIGKIDITIKNNPKLQDTSSRETFNNTKEFDNFYAICLKGIIYQIQNLRVVDKQVSKLTVKDFFADSSPKILQQEVTRAVKEKKPPEEIKTIVDKFSEKLNSNLKELQERVEYYAQLASAGTFSKVIIHELRNNVNPIQRFNRNVFDQFSPLKGNISKYYIQSEDSCKRLINLSDAFAPLSRQSFKKEKYNCMLYSQVNNVELLLHDYLENSKIKFINDVDRGVSVQMHPGELQTVLINLIDNAIFWVNKSKKEDKVIHVSSILEDKDVLIQISDNGVGVDPDLGDAIFKPGVTCKPNGFGMGLVVVNELVSSHGGYLKNIQPGTIDGATFEFSAPIQK